MAVTSCENTYDTIIVYNNNRLYVLYTETHVTCFMNAFHSQWPWTQSHTVRTENLSLVSTGLLMGVTPSGVGALITSPSYPVHPSLKEFTAKSTSQLVPCMLYGVQTWGIR